MRKYASLPNASPLIASNHLARYTSSLSASKEPLCKKPKIAKSSQGKLRLAKSTTQKGKRAVASSSDALSSKYVYESDLSDLTKLSMEKDKAEGRKN